MTQPYEIHLLDNGQLHKLDLNDAPAIVYQLNTLANLTDRQATFSQTVKLPITNNNCRVFGYANEIDVDQSYAYNALPCFVYCNGTQIIGRNFVLQLKRRTRYFECQIVSNALDFFTQLASQDVADMDLGDVVYTPQGVADATSNYPGTSRYTWMLANGSIGARDGVSSDSTLPPSTNSRLLLRYIYPVVSLWDLVGWILDSVGYTLVTDLTDQEDFIPCDRIADDRSITNTQTYATDTFTVSTDVPDDGAIYLTTVVPSSAVNPWGALTAQQDIYGNQTIVWTAYAEMQIRINWTVRTGSGSRTDTAAIHVQKYAPGDTLNGTFDDLYENFPLMGPGYSDTFNTTIEVNEGDRIVFWWALSETNGSGTNTFTWELSIQPVIDEYAIPGVNFPLAPNIPFETKEDVLKQFVSLYGLTVDVKQDEKQLVCYSMNRPYDNKDAGIYYDWSDKISKEKDDTIEYSVGEYGQTNRLLFSENSTEEYRDIGTFTISDNKLSEVVDVIELAFLSVRNVRLLVSTSADFFYIASLPVYEKTEETFFTTSWGQVYQYKYTGMPLAVLRRNPTYGNISGPIYVTVNGSETPVSSVVMIGIQNTAQQYLDMYFDKIINNLLRWAKTLTAKFNLDPEDLLNIDLLRPVYIRHFGAFFYISKISSYIYGRLNNVTLIKL